MEPLVRSVKREKRQTNVNVKVQEMSHSQRTEWKQYIHAVDWLQQVARYFFYSSKRSETKLSSTVPKVNRKLSHNDSIHFSVWSFLCYWIKTSSLCSRRNLGGGRRPRKAGEKTGNGGNGGGGLAPTFLAPPPRLCLLRRLSDFTHFIFAFSEISCMLIDQQH